MYSTCTAGCLKSNMISWNSFKHGGSGVQFKVSFEHSVSKGRKDLVVSPSDNYIETIQTECQNVTTVTQMLANRLQGSFIPQIKRIPPSKGISFNLLWIKCQCCYAMILFFETSAVVFPIHIKFRTKWKKSRNRFTHRFCHLLVLKMVH